MIIFENTFRDLMVAANVVGSRVFFARAPQKPAEQMSSPYIVFFMVAPITHPTMGGPLTLMNRHYQVDIYDTMQTRVTGIADTLRAYLDGYKGVFENVDFGSIWNVNQTWTYEPDTRLFRALQEYEVMYRLIDAPTAVTTAAQNRSRRINVNASDTA